MPKFLPMDSAGAGSRTEPAAVAAIKADATLSELMRVPDDGSFITVRVPTITPDRVLYDPIYLNANVTFWPGQTYTLHPVVAREVYKAIRNHAEAIVKQKTGRIIESDDLVGELKRQEAAERRTLDQFESLGMRI